MKRIRGAEPRLDPALAVADGASRQMGAVSPRRGVAHIPDGSSARPSALRSKTARDKFRPAVTFFQARIAGFRVQP